MRYATSMEQVSHTSESTANTLDSRTTTLGALLQATDAYSEHRKSEDSQSLPFFTQPKNSNLILNIVRPHEEGASTDAEILDACTLLLISHPKPYEVAKLIDDIGLIGISKENIKDPKFLRSITQLIEAASPQITNKKEVEQLQRKLSELLYQTIRKEWKYFQTWARKFLIGKLQSDDPQAIAIIEALAVTAETHATWGHYESTDHDWKYMVTLASFFEEVAGSSDNFMLKKRAEQAAKQAQANGYQHGETTIEDIYKIQYISARRRNMDKLEFSPPSLDPVIPLAVGKVGAYDMVSGNLKSYSELDDPSHEWKGVSAMDIYANPTEDAFQTLEHFDAAKDLQFFFSINMRRIFEQELGVDISALDTRTQYNFLSYLKRSSLEEVERFKLGIQSNGKTYLNAFVSLESGNSGQVIENILSQLGNEQATKVFEKYDEFLASVDRVEEYLQKIDGGLGISARRNVIGALLEKGQNVLRQAADESGNEEKLSSILERANADLILTLAALKTLNKSGTKPQLEQLPGVQTTFMYGGKLEDIQSDEGRERILKKRSQLIRIADQNWSGRGNMHQAVIDGLQSRLEDSSVRISCIEINDLVEAFYRIEPTSPDERFFGQDQTGPDDIYFGSVNVRKEAQGFGLAPVMLQQMFRHDAEGKRVTAHCDPWDTITAQYVGDEGFVITGLLKNYHQTGQPLFEIERDDRPDTRSSYEYSGKSYEELLRLSLDKNSQIKQFVFEHDFYEAPDDPENQRFLRELEGLLQEGVVLSNYRLNKRKDGKIDVLLAVESRKTISKPETN